MASVKKMSLKDRTINVLFGWAAAFLSVCFFLTVFKYIFNEFPYDLFGATKGWQALVFGCIIAPITEELIFRHAPFQLLKQSKDYRKKEFSVLIISSMVFGLLHGSFMNVYIQGVAGFFFGLTYIRNGYNYWSSVISHSLYNFCIMFLLPNLVHFQQININF